VRDLLVVRRVCRCNKEAGWEGCRVERAERREGSERVVWMSTVLRVL
jgi:hypothetical protein